MSQITLAEAKDFLRISNTAQDDTIQVIIDGAEEWVGRTAGRSISEEGHVEYLTGGGKALRPSHRPVVSVSEVYDTESGAAEDSGDWDLVRDGIYRDSMDRWESAPENRWRVTYVGGEAMPDGLKLATLMLIHRAYENRDGIEHQSAAGYGTTFDTLAHGDIATMVGPYKRGGAWIG